MSVMADPASMLQGVDRMDMQRYTQSTGVSERAPLLYGLWLHGPRQTIACLLGLLVVFSPIMVQADEAAEIRQTLELIGYEVVEPVDSKAPAPKTSKKPEEPREEPDNAPQPPNNPLPPMVWNKPKVLLESPDNARLKLISTSIRIIPPHLRDPKTLDFTCETGFQWGSGNRLEQDGDWIECTFLIFHDENLKPIGGGTFQTMSTFHRGRPAYTSGACSQMFPHLFRSGWGTLVVIGADSKSSPLRLLGYQRFRIPPMKREPPVKQEPRSGGMRLAETVPTPKAADVLP